MGLMEKIWVDGMRRYEACLYQMLTGEKCSRVLDLGCGGESFTIKVIPKRESCEVFGVESDKEKVKKAQMLGMKVFCCDLNKTFPFIDSSLGNFRNLT